MGPERKIQVKVTDYAKQRYGALCKKGETGRFGSSGWPDYTVLGERRVARLTMPRAMENDVISKQWLEDVEKRLRAKGVKFTEPVCFFVEFKAPGGKLTPLQDQIRKRIESKGFHYYLVDDPDEGKSIIDEELGSCLQK